MWRELIRTRRALVLAVAATAAACSSAGAENQAEIQPVTATEPTVEPTVATTTTTAAPTTTVTSTTAPPTTTASTAPPAPTSTVAPPREGTDPGLVVTRHDDGTVSLEFNERLTEDEKAIADRYRQIHFSLREIVTEPVSGNVDAIEAGVVPSQVEPLKQAYLTDIASGEFFRPTPAGHEYAWVHSVRRLARDHVTLDTCVVSDSWRVGPDGQVTGSPGEIRAISTDIELRLVEGVWLLSARANKEEIATWCRIS